jgi:hypothetical protein
MMILLTFSRNANADIAILLKQNEPAPFKGMLLDMEKANKIQEQLQEADLVKILSESQQQSIDKLKQSLDISEQKSTLLLDQNKKLAEDLDHVGSITTIEKIGLFALGCAVTIGAGMALRH